ncbi:MAG: DUF378 domain-containing protein [Candidatus Woesebacteria bacterium]|jgi:uncharacterized membrane protein YuzA (DUF378 family)
MKLNTADIIGYVLVVVGGVNWGLVGLFEFNLVDSIFGEGSVMARIVYALVGLAAVYMIFPFFKLIGKAK